MNWFTNKQKIIQRTHLDHAKGSLLPNIKQSSANRTLLSHTHTPRLCKRKRKEIIQLKTTVTDLFSRWIQAIQQVKGSVQFENKSNEMSQQDDACISKREFSSNQSYTLKQVSREEGESA